MESTGKYWIPVYNILEKDCSIILAHPNMLRLSMERRLTRKMPNGLLICFKSGEKNRLQNCLTVPNIQLGNVVSDTFSKSAQAILDKLLENPANTFFDFEPLVFKRLKKELLELHDVIDGYITPEQDDKLKVIKAHYESLKSRKSSIKSSFLRSPLPISRTFLQRNTYAHGLALSQPAMKVQGRKNLSGFPRPDATSSPFWCNVQMLSSSQKASCSQENNHSIARRLLTALYHMLKSRENYNAELYRRSELLSVDCKITVEQLLMIV